jgi:hypothetical protein
MNSFVYQYSLINLLYFFFIFNKIGKPAVASSYGVRPSDLQYKVPAGGGAGARSLDTFKTNTSSQERRSF